MLCFYVEQVPSVHLEGECGHWLFWIGSFHHEGRDVAFVVGSCRPHLMQSSWSLVSPYKSTSRQQDRLNIGQRAAQLFCTTCCLCPAVDSCGP